jgi:hypothetical protein
VKSIRPIEMRKPLFLSLDLKGGTSNVLRNTACHACTSTRRARSVHLGLTIVDFSSKTDLIDLQEGKAQLAFRFTCYPHHHFRADKEYM